MRHFQYTAWFSGTYSHWVYTLIPTNQSLDHPSYPQTNSSPLKMERCFISCGAEWPIYAGVCVFVSFKHVFSCSPPREVDPNLMVSYLAEETHEGIHHNIHRNSKTSLGKGIHWLLVWRCLLCNQNVFKRKRMNSKTKINLWTSI